MTGPPSLSSSDPHFESLFELAGRLARIGPWCVEVPDMRVRWSDEVCRILEMPLGMVPALAEALELFVGDSRERIAAALDTCAARGEPFDLELQLISAKGRPLWVRAIGEAVLDESGAIGRIHGALQDITDLKTAEERLRTTLESITDAFYTLDREWRFTFLNGEAARLLRRSPGELLGRHIWSEFKEAIGTQIYDEYHRALRDNVATSFETYYAPLEGFFQIRAYPSPEGLAVYFLDVTVQKTAEQALRTSEERFRNITRATTDAVWEWDFPTDRLWWSEGVRTFGYEPADLGPTPDAWIQRIHPDDVDRVVGGFRSALAARQETWTDQYRFRRKDGGYAYVLDRAFITYGPAGQPLMTFGGLADVSERQKLEEQRQHAQHLSALGQLTGGIAHEFNNLLTVVMGSAELLESRLRHDPLLHQTSEMIQTAAHRAAGLTAQLLAFARRQPLVPMITDVNQVILGMCRLLQTALGESVELSITPGHYRALVDPSQLELAILNLALNARDAMPEGGSLTIEILPTSHEEATAALDLAPGKYILLRVSDEGVGMTPETLERVFEPFFTTKEVGKGTGLGLSMVHGFARQSGGDIAIESSPGLGTVVSLYLPMMEAPVQERSPTSSAPEVVGGSERILLVEDDDLVRAHVRGRLTRLGYAVTEAPHAPAALELLKDTEVDLLFTDVVMLGGLSGPQLAEEARRHQPDLPVLLTTGHSAEVVSLSPAVGKGFHLLNKPYSEADLAAKLRKVFGDARPVTAPPTSSPPPSAPSPSGSGGS